MTHETLGDFRIEGWIKDAVDNFLGSLFTLLICLTFDWHSIAINFEKDLGKHSPYIGKHLAVIKVDNE